MRQWMHETVVLAAVCTTWAVAEDWRKPYAPQDHTWKQTKQHFIYNSGAEPETLDPNLVTAMDAFRLVEALFEGLTAADPKTLEPRPAAAERWDISDDGLTYTFHLRDGLRWSDGNALVAEDFAKSAQRVLTPATAASYASLYYAIVGAEDFHSGKTADVATVGVKALDAKTLEIRLHSPCGFILDLLTMPVFYPVRVDIIEKHGEKWTHPDNIVTNGPFVLETWLPRDRLILKKSPTYWDRDFVKLEMVTALAIDDLNTAYKLYLENKVHWLPGLPQPRMEEIKRHPDYYVAPFLGTYFYRFSVTKPPFDNVLVRRAFCRATDRKEITDELLKSGQQPTAAFCPEVAGYKPVEGLTYDATEARKLLRQAGYGDGGKAFPAVELTYNTSEGHKQIAEAIVQQWKRNLGVNVTTRNTEWKVFLSDMKALKFEICRSSWIGDYNDPSTFFDIFEGRSGNNRTGWINIEYDTLMARTRRERSHAKRLKLFARMEKILVEEDAPILPIYGYVDTGLLAESVLGWYTNVRSAHPLKYIWLETY